MNDNKADTLPKEPLSEDFEIRCPRLGHQINFSYCEIENSGIPCFKTLDCWYSYFDVHSFLKDKLSKEDFQKAFANKGQPKVLSLLDLIEKAKKKKGKKN